MTAIVEPGDASSFPRPCYNPIRGCVVVVGGETGIELGIVQATLGAGADVPVASRRRFAGPALARFERIELDIVEEAAARAAFGAIGRLDRLVIAAGPAFGGWGAFADPDMAGVRDVVGAKFLGFRACARRPHRRGRLPSPDPFQTNRGESR